MEKVFKYNQKRSNGRNIKSVASANICFFSDQQLLT